MKPYSYFIFLILIGLTLSCEEETEPDSRYEGIPEIQIPTSSPRGLAFDGSYLWYSDDSLNTLNKISAEGQILETIELSGKHITGFDISDENIWCINDTTVYQDTLVSPYPYSCICKLSRSGELVDSILIQASVNPRKPEFIGLVKSGATLYGTTHQGWSSCLYKIDIPSRSKTFLHYHYMAGLTLRNDTLYGIDQSYMGKSRIVALDSSYEIIGDPVKEVEYEASDLAFAGPDLWIVDRDNRKLIKY